MKTANTPKLNFGFFFVDLQHYQAFANAGRAADVIKFYENNETNYFKTTKKALENNIDKINPRNLSYEDISSLHRDLTEHFATRPSIEQERTFGLNAASCNEDGIKEFINSNTAGEDFLEFSLLNDPCLYQIKADKQITRSLTFLTSQKNKYDNAEDGQVNLINSRNEIFPSEKNWQSLVNSSKEKFPNSAVPSIKRIEENFLLLKVDKLDEESKNLISYQRDVNLENVAAKIYENLTKPGQLTGLEFNLNINKRPKETRAEFSKILEEYNNSVNERWSELQNDTSGNEVTTLVGKTMKKISQLHPFVDGNARTTFILSNVIFIKLGLEPFHPEVQSIFDMNSDDRILEKIAAGRSAFKDNLIWPENMAYTKPTTITNSMYESLLMHNTNKNSVTILSENAETKTRKITCRKDEFNKAFAKVEFCQNSESLFNELGLSKDQYHLAENENYCVIPQSITSYFDIKDGVISVQNGKEDLLKNEIKPTAAKTPQPVSYTQLSEKTLGNSKIN